MGKIKDRIAEIDKLQEKLNNELTALKEACSHDEYYVGTYSWRAGSYDQMRICTECYSTLGAPSDSELKDFNDEYDELHKESIEKRRIEKENNKNENLIFVDSSIRFGHGTKIYKND